jgi:transmembrane sensor
MVSAALVVLAVIGWQSIGPTASTEVTSAQGPAQVTPDSRVVRFPDGSSVELVGRDSEIRVAAAGPTAVEVELLRGRGRFRVAPDAARRFVVRSAAVTVMVVGTEFSVEQRGDRTLVEVSSGTVRVSWTTGEDLLESGERGMFPPVGRVDATIGATPSVASLSSETPRLPPGARVGATASVSEKYRERAGSRDYAEAYRLMRAVPSVVGASADELMLAADVARLSGHPEEAVSYLRRVVEEQPGDPRAPLAAFTAGRALMGMGRPAEAMRAFAQVTALGGPLAEDALARQVEAARQAGDLAAARRLAQQYLRQYPSGSRNATVRRQGGLE